MNFKADINMVDGIPVNQSVILEKEDGDVVIQDIHIRRNLSKKDPGDPDEPAVKDDADEA
jgi:hypothetical protein